MSTPSKAVPDFPIDSQEIAPPAMSTTRPMVWSVRRELWQNRSIFIAPLVVAVVVLCGFLFGAMTLPSRMPAALALDPAQQRAVLIRPYAIVALLIILTTFIVGVVYCLDALYSERRDRSILFWKSLPVSDLTTVLSKASIPLVVLPLFIFAVIVVTQMNMLLMSTTVLIGNSQALTTLWSRLPLFKMPLALLYTLASIALWHAPIYAWLLLVSGWARRATFLWVALPLLAVSVFERVAFDTSHFASLLKYRMIGWFTQAFAFKPQDGEAVELLAQLTPAKFLSTPGLWIGLAFAAACLAAAVRLRRHQEAV